MMFGSAAVREWTNWELTGYLCNSAGTTDAYDCDGTYSVYYYQEARYYQFPDGTGRIDTEYRSNGTVASYAQEDGQCGYEASRIERVYYGYSPNQTYAGYQEAYNSGITGSIWINTMNSSKVYASQFGDEHAPEGRYCTNKTGDWGSSSYISVVGW